MGYFDDDTIRRFWSKVEKTGDDECWKFLGYHWASGYPCFWADGESWRANRVALIIHCGNIEPLPDMLSCHTCHNKGCVNPNHLYWGTDSSNRFDRLAVAPNGPDALTMFKAGEGHPQHKLLESQVEYIKLLLDAGYAQAQIARWYCVSATTIRHISIGKVWGWCPRWKASVQTGLPLDAFKAT